MQGGTYALPTEGPSRSLPHVEGGAYRALVDGLWSVVDRFERDGRRFVVVAENAPSVRPRVALTPREKRAARLARMGLSNKVIAYELRLSESMASATIRSVATKLGARSRLDLVRLLASLPDGDPAAARAARST